LLRRPLLEAISQDKPPVLLIDEIDRTDEEFEAFLLELLAEFQVTIPELGTLKAKHRPYVILTSNRSRELSDALRRRCLYLWQNYPSFEKEVEIVRARVPEISERLAQKIAQVMAHLRELPLNKAPGVAESLDWAQALVSLHREHLDMAVLEATLGVILKDRDDLQLLQSHKPAIKELVLR
jgi:MoxR-like ATPase